MPLRLRVGLTRVELLVLLTVVVIVLALLLPALQGPSGVSRRNQCMIQIKNLAYAAVQYENTHHGMPGYLNHFGTYTPPSSGLADPSDPDNAPMPHEKIGGWAIALFPYLDAQPTYEHWTEDRYPLLSSNLATTEGYSLIATPNLPMLICPDSPVDEATWGRNDYCANNGWMPDAFYPAGSAPSSPATALVEAEKKANGAINSKYNLGGWMESPQVRLDDFKDGQSSTILFSENLQAQPWHLVNFSSAGSGIAALTASPPDVTPTVVKCLQGFVWHQRDEGDKMVTATTGPAPDNRMRINSGNASGDKYSVTMDYNNYHLFARPSSAHADGVNAGMADGATRFISESVDYRVYQALMTLDGENSDVPFTKYILRGESL